MAECDYCEEAFDDEEALLDHMADVHEGELGRIDRRRVADHTGEGGGELPTGPIAIVLIVFVSAAVVAFVIFGGPSDGGNESLPSPVALDDVSPSGLEAEPLPENGDEAALADAEQFPSEGAQHVSSGTDVDYDTSPPTSGDHYSSPAEPGFYEETPPLGNLVHSLEHGHVVIYYDPGAITPEARQSLQEFVVANNDGPWAAVIVAPNPSDDPESPYVLTAWRNMLRMDGYNASTTRAFIAEYMGRGPENPVR